MWSTETTDDFDRWFAMLGEEEQVEVAAKVTLLAFLGPQLKRPHADTLNGSRYANMKELRARTGRAVMRIAFAFDPMKRGILLVGGDKSGVSQKRFYKQLITRADILYTRHLERIENHDPQKGKK